MKKALYRLRVKIASFKLFSRIICFYARQHNYINVLGIVARGHSKGRAISLAFRAIILRK